MNMLPNPYALASMISLCLSPAHHHVVAWSFAPVNTRPWHHNIRSSNLSKTTSLTRSKVYPLSATSKPLGTIPYAELSSAYDRELPPSMVGEAVRAALRSDRGICFDFSTNRFSKIGSDSRLVSVVKIHGRGTRSFLNAKFSQSVPEHSDEESKMKLTRSGVAFETAYLTSKGRVIDRILVVAFLNSKDDDDNEAFLITSPGNSGSTLFSELAPLVFPMDQVTLTDCTSSSAEDKTSIITLACSKLKDSQTSFNNNVVGFLDEQYSNFEFPGKSICNHYYSNGSDVYVLEHTFLSTDVCYGYSLIIRGDGSLSNKIWNHLIAEQNDIGPVGVGSLEYETLRIDAGISGYGYELTGDGPKKKLEDNGDECQVNEYYSKANPLELHLEHLVDTEKGCYQGQEGVVSMMKNARGSPRTLYQVVFYDSENEFDDNSIEGGFLMSIDTDKLRAFQQIKKQSTLSNDTRQPRPGDELFVLGSNESILVGTITSVAQPNGTGEATTVALALIRRADSILKSIQEQNLDMPRWWERPGDEGDDNDDDVSKSGISRDKGSSGIMLPPPLDPLVNLEVTIGGTYTIGRLQSVPSRRYSNNGPSTMASLLDYEGRGQVVYTSDEDTFIQPEITVVNDGKDESRRRVIDVSIGEDDPFLTNIAEAEKEAAEAAKKAEEAAAEAKRKAEKIEMLKAKAEAAIAARKKRKQAS